MDCVLSNREPVLSAVCSQQWEETSREMLPRSPVSPGLVQRGTVDTVVASIPRSQELQDLCEGRHLLAHSEVPSEHMAPDGLCIVQVSQGSPNSALEKEDISSPCMRILKEWSPGSDGRLFICRVSTEESKVLETDGQLFT